MRTHLRAVRSAAVLALGVTLCVLALAAPAMAWWPMSGHPVAMPFGGQSPTEMTGAVTTEPGDLDALWAGLDPGTTYYDTPNPGEELMLHWRYAAQWYAATGPSADVVTGYVLFDWNDIERPAATANTHWGTNIVTSVDPNDYWPLLPPRSTWLWTGRYQGVTFTSWGWGMHVIQEKWTGCNQNHGLTAYVTWAFDNPWDVHGQAWVVRGQRH